MTRNISFKYNDKPFEGGLFSHIEKASLVLSSSPIHIGSLSTLINNSTSELHTLNTPNSWYKVDLGKHQRFIPNYYCLRNHPHAFHIARNWRLEGSISGNGNDWTILRTHTNDTSLQTSSSVGCWPLKYTSESANDTPASNGYRYFRLIQFGPTSTDDYYFCISSFELYGTLIIESGTSHI